MNSRRQILFFTAILGAMSVSCGPKHTIKDGSSVINDLIKKYNFMAPKRTISKPWGGTLITGTLITGRPSTANVTGHSINCFPKEWIPRHSNYSYLHHKYQTQISSPDKLGFLFQTNSGIRPGPKLGGLGPVDIELYGPIIEHMKTSDISDWYRNGMQENCKNYLRSAGFVIQSLMIDHTRLSIKDSSGDKIALNAKNIGQYFVMDESIKFQLKGPYTIEITTPVYIGYQLGHIRLKNDKFVFYRATSTKNNRYVFGSVASFYNKASLYSNNTLGKNPLSPTALPSFITKKNEQIGLHAIFIDDQRKRTR